MRRHLLGPLIRRVHRMRPADGVVVAGFRSAEVVDLAHEEFRSLEPGHSVEHGYLVEAAVRRAFRGGAVVAEDVVDQRVVEDFQVLQRVEQAADMVVSMLEERGIDLHLAGENRLERRGHGVVGGDFVGALGEDRIRRDHAQLLLPGKGLFAQLVPTGVELALVLLDPLLRHLMGSVGGAGREVHEERLVGHERLLLAHPADRLVRHVLREVVALFRALALFHRRRAFVNGGIPLVGLAADEAVEVLESAAAGGPLAEGPQRARLPDRHLVALAELRGRVAVELERHRERRLVLRQHRRVSGCRGRDLADAAHVDRMVIPPGEQALGAWASRVRWCETASASARSSPAARHSAWGSGPPKALVAPNPQSSISTIRTLGAPLGGRSELDRRKGRIRILRVVGGQSYVVRIRDRKDRSLNPVLRTHGASPLDAWLIAFDDAPGRSGCGPELDPSALPSFGTVRIPAWPVPCLRVPRPFRP